MLKMKQSCASDRRRATKMVVFPSLGSLLSKKFEFYLRADILKTVSPFLIFFKSLRD